MTDPLPFGEIEKLLVLDAPPMVTTELRDFYRHNIQAEIKTRLEMAIEKHLKAYEKQQIKSASELKKVVGRIAKDFLNPNAFTAKKK